MKQTIDNLSNPSNVETVREIIRNERFTVLLKADKTYCIRVNYTGKEHGHFLTEQDALNFYDDINADDCEPIE